ncbi:antitoxin VbhA family protein [Bartonella ancashensis]|uniref:Antitoxin VbhA domain-containing protein n=1 Tax=Bartonella ancashensis TaxID=1318743 RepID=A0A0M4LRW8_9HYPH|nr:antitoxin VbhA family protein [Bartonella ancashensis]ALE03047.1 hypothetical protein PU02_0233 [Bartonella ancashensis]ARE31044.1 biaA [Bartonella ancashensis]
MTTNNPTSLTEEELQKRREAVDFAISTHELEGIKLHPKTLEILEGYAKGDYSLEEFNTLMDQAQL